MGVGTRTKAWRFTDINKDYSVCFFHGTYEAATDTLALVFTDISRALGCTYPYQRHYTAICRQISE